MDIGGLAIAGAKRISANRAFFRHRVDEDQLISMLLTVLQTGRWMFPPPLVVECKRGNQRFYWVLDGHHRIHVSQILSANRMGAGKIWSFVVDEAAYDMLIKRHFGGVEPAQIGAVREHILTPGGTANLSDENWKSIQKRFSKGAFIHKPIFVYEKHDKTLKNIGHINLGTDQRGQMFVRSQKETQNVFKIRNPQAPIPFKEKAMEVPLTSFAGDDIRLASHFQIDRKKQLMQVAAKDRGIVLSPDWMGAEIGSSAGEGRLTVGRKTFYAQAIMMIMAMKIKNFYRSETVRRNDIKIEDMVPAHLVSRFRFSDVNDFLFDGVREIYRQQRDTSNRRPSWVS